MSSDEDRREVAASGLTPTAVAHLTRDALGTIEFANLAPVKTLLKRFFSAEPWTAADDDALAALVGPGAGWWRYELDDRFRFEFGWRDGAFRLELSPLGQDTPTRVKLGDAAGFAATFDGPVVPEATPNPRSIRFVTPPIHDGPSRWYESAGAADDPRVAQVFAVSSEVANVLVGPDFVAVGLRRPDAWEQLLDPLLRVVTAEFAPTTPVTEPARAEAVAANDASSDDRPPSLTRPRALDDAWRALSTLELDQPDDLEQLLAAASAADVATRQVAARVLIEADAPVAAAAWERLVDDRSRTVRRATVDAMVDAQRPELRALLERALDDSDAWTRWKALRGLVELGIEPSRDLVAPLTEDPDFRVRLESGRALRGPRG